MSATSTSTARLRVSPVPGSAADLPLRVAILTAEQALAGRLTTILKGDAIDVTMVDRPVTIRRDSEQPAVFVAAASRPEAALALVEELNASRLEVPFLVVVGRATSSWFRDVLSAGADGVILEPVLEAGLVPAVRAVATGHVVVPRAIRASLARPSLSTREKQVLAMVVLGFTNAEIAQKLFLAESTVKSHLSSAFVKLGVRSRNEAAALILDPEKGLGTGILAIANDAERVGPAS